MYNKAEPVETTSLFPPTRKYEMKRSIVSLVVLFLIYVLNQADRQVLPVVIPAGLRCYSNSSSHCEHSNISLYSIEDDKSSTIAPSSQSNCEDVGCLDFTDKQQGILLGPAFVIVYSVAGIPLARLADATSRVYVLIVGFFAWNLLVLLSGLSWNYWVLLVSRIGLGIGEATCNPAAYALIADYFDFIDRTKALSFYHFAVYVGGAIGYALGAINVLLCWRWTFFIISIAGFVMVFVACATLREPERKDSTLLQGRTYTIKETLSHLKNKKPFLVLTLAAAIRNIGGYALGAWLSTFYAKTYNQTSDQYGIKLAMITLFGGGSSSLVAGVIADKLSEHHQQSKAYIIAVSQLIALPCTLGSLLITSNVSLSYGLLFLAYLFSETWLGCAAAIIQDLFSPSIRSQASAVYLAFNTSIGGTLGPLLVPIIMNAKPSWSDCDQGVGYALSITVGTSYILSSILFYIVGVLMTSEEMAVDETIFMSYETSDMEISHSEAEKPI